LLAIVLVKVDLMSSRRGSARQDELLGIGEVARRSGKAASAIRYYEEIGLLPEPRRANGRRHYQADVVRTLAIVETAQRAGLSLDEIRLLLRASPEDVAATERLREVAERKLPPLREAIERAQLVHGWLEDAARCCCPTLEDCPLFDEPERLPERTVSLR
jgi:MerR family redox-sensitive transcriptional activator SoxR